MIDLAKYNLINPRESESLYQEQSMLLNRLYEENDSEVLLKISILITLPPIADYGEAIKLLKAGYQDTNNMKFVIIGSYLSSTWEPYKNNTFVDFLNLLLCKVSDDEKAIVYYLKAYDILRHNEAATDCHEYENLLKKSIQLSDKNVYPYYYLAQISEKEKSKELLRKALSNVKKVYSEEECKEVKISNLLSYRSFLDEHILGVTLSQPNFEMLQDLIG